MAKKKKRGKKRLSTEFPLTKNVIWEGQKSI